MKNGKTPGPDIITAEIIKCAGDKAVQEQPNCSTDASNRIVYHQAGKVQMSSFSTKQEMQKISKTTDQSAVCLTHTNSSQKLSQIE